MISSIIQIKRRLSQVAVWRFVGLVSTIVGLVCYALSSSFNYLFGKWNLMKIILYSVFSIFICLWTLFPKVCQSSTSLRFKAHTAFLVLTITSVYSYFADKAVNGKPDVYSVISCAAFAIMSLSLSMQIQCGFEVDLLYFFLGCLIVLLMKIKLALTIVGVGFSYGLIILRSSLDATSYQNLAVQDEHSVVIDINSVRTDNTSKMQQLMACITELQQGNSKLTNMVFKHVKEYLEVNTQLPEIDHNFVIDFLPLGKIDNLCETIKIMMDTGFAKECFEVYCNWRRESLEKCLTSLLDLPKMNIMDKSERMEFEDYIIRRQIKAIWVALRTLLPGERRLCHRVFSGFSSTAAISFIDVCRGVTIQLLDIANVFTSGIPSYWRLFEILRMFEEWRDLFPEFQTLFPESLVNEPMAVHYRLEEASMGIFIKVINLILRYPEMKAFATNCGIHVMTIDVMRVLISTCLAKQALENNGAGTCSFSVRIDRIMKRLERKLVTEFKNSKRDPALLYFYMMNNWRFVELSIQESGLDVHCLKKYTTKVDQNIKLYLSCSWSIVIETLKLKNNELVEPNSVEELLKGKLHLFNKHFEDKCRIQTRWFALDNHLREQIITSVQNILLPVYGNFIGRFQDVQGKHAYQYIKYGMFDIQDQLNNMFLSSTETNHFLKQKESLLKLVSN